MQMWVDLLNTPILQASPTLDEFADASPFHRRSSASPTPHPRALFQPPPSQPSYPPPYNYPPYSYPPPPVSGSSGGNAPPSYIYPSPSAGGSSGGNDPPPYPYPPPPPYRYPSYGYPPPAPVVHQVVLLLKHIHTLHLNLFTSEVVTTRVMEKTSLIQLKLIRE
jgi:hypothetical protein